MRRGSAGGGAASSAWRSARSASSLMPATIAARASPPAGSAPSRRAIATANVSTPVTQPSAVGCGGAGSAAAGARLIPTSRRCSACPARCRAVSAPRAACSAPASATAAPTLDSASNV
jgi:hypothetical protein